MNAKRRRSNEPPIDNCSAVHQEGENEFAEAGGKVKKPAKKKKKKSSNNDSEGQPRPKKKAKSGGINGEGAATTENLGSLDKDVGSSQQQDEQAGERRMSAYDEYLVAMAEDEEKSRGETDDDDLDPDDVPFDDDVADEKYLVDSKPKQKKSTKSTSDPISKKTNKDAPKKKGTKAKVKIEKRPKGEKKAGAMEALRKVEQRRFEACEKEFVPLIRRWEKAISNEDADQISRVYDRLLKEMEKFTAPFMEEYNLNDLMKQSKRIVNNEKRKEVLKNFAVHYKKKKSTVPDGFKAKKQEEIDDNETSVVKSESQTKESEPTAKTPLLRLKLESEAPNSGDDIAAEKKEDENGVIGKRKTTVAANIPRSASQSQNLEANAEITTQLVKSESFSQQSSQKPAPAANKPERKKKFSLGNLMRPASGPSEPGMFESKPTSSIRREPSEGVVQPFKTQKVLTWTVQATDSENVSDEDRLYALEFLEQAVPHISGSSINHDAIARNIESAVFKWAVEGNQSINSKSLLNGNYKKSFGAVPAADEREWVDRYWNKIHDLVAAISGKHKEGTVAAMIREGKFQTPSDLVLLSEDNLWKSFEGKPLDM
mmetsp:Transcript_15038/g.27045  ORF Transcript_15038/g.27045 Transcript_15038/m.27045 type:complete len:598 (-) Transcript_15038:199-1992(-)